MPLAQQICCGYCDPDCIDCVETVLQVLIRSAAHNLCTHEAQPGMLCLECGQTVLLVAERAANSTWWAPVDEAATIRETARLLKHHRLITPEQATRLADNFAVGSDFSDEYLHGELPRLLNAVSLVDLEDVITDLQTTATTPDWPRTKPRQDPSHPSRAAYHRGEFEMAKRLGLDEPPRYLTERAVRQAAVEALSEADFIRLAHAANVRLIPRVGSTSPGVIAYSAVLSSLPVAQQREFGAKNLARDLTLDQLRTTWGSPDPLAAWATWRTYTGITALQARPEPRADGRWRWIHPDADHTIPLIDPPSSMPKTPHARREAARALLTATQGGVCAMCSISYHNWHTRDAERCPILGPAEHLDHDHNTGLIRGLLCIRCNTSKEPLGAAAGSDTWRVYNDRPPAADLGCSWPWS